MSLSMMMIMVMMAMSLTILLVSRPYVTSFMLLIAIFVSFSFGFTHHFGARSGFTVHFGLLWLTDIPSFFSLFSVVVPE